jgi:hypothetical protein
MVSCLFSRKVADFSRHTRRGLAGSDSKSRVRPGALGGQPRARWTAPILLRVRTTCVGWCWNGKEKHMSDEARVREEPAVLSAREVIALLGREPEPESADEDPVEPAMDVVGDPKRRS